MENLEGWTETAPGLYEDRRTCKERGSHYWQDASSIHGTHHWRICRQCGEQEQLGPIGDDERATALAQMGAIQAQEKKNVWNL